MRHLMTLTTYGPFVIIGIVPLNGEVNPYQVHTSAAFMVEVFLSYELINKVYV